MVEKFLSPHREIGSRFGDCLPFGDMSLAVPIHVAIVGLLWLILLPIRLCFEGASL